jgi:8-hydroxy-5-deazaflavin:NADPH oxidoreductase
MKVGLIGSGVVAQTLGAKLVELGHDVVLGTRDPKKLDEKKNMAGTLNEWLANVKNKAKVGTFKEAAVHGEILINATHGQNSIDALKLAEADKVGGKILMDTGNELDFSKGMPPGTLAAQDHCLAENIQKAFPNLKVVKAFNMMAAPLMVNPKMLKGGDHTFLICGNDATAKTQVTEILKSFGWADILDLGDIGAARGCEMYLGLWIRLWGSLQNPMLNIKVQR